MGQALGHGGLQAELAPSLTLHPQGMTLDCVEISLGRVFASGQAYVALSRARSLQGLRVLDFDPMVVRCDPRVLRFYASLRRDSGLGPVRGSHPGVRQGTLGRGGRAFSGPIVDRAGGRRRWPPGCGPGGQQKFMTRVLWLPSRSLPVMRKQTRTRRMWIQTFEPQREDRGWSPPRPAPERARTPGHSRGGWSVPLRPS